jgi:protein subunit release factor B
MHSSMINNSPIVHLTKDDFEIEFYRSGGNGGQNVNKVATACRIYHRPSGCVTTCEEERLQLQNKRRAFEKLVAQPKFMEWLKRQHFIKLGKQMSEAQIERQVEEMMDVKNLKFEIKENGKWVEIGLDKLIGL